MVLILDILQIPEEIVNLYQCSDQSRGHLNVQNSDLFGIQVSTCPELGSHCIFFEKIGNVT